MYRLDLLAKMKIYLVQYIIILELVYRDLELLVYKVDTYKGQKEDKQLVKKVISYEEVDNKTQYKILWEGYCHKHLQLILRGVWIRLGNVDNTCLKEYRLQSKCPTD